MAEVEIDGQHHVIRHVPWAKLERRDGEVIGFTPYAFRVRVERDERDLSGAWAEFFDGDHPTQVRSAARSLKEVINVSPTSAFAVGNAAAIRAAASVSVGVAIRVVWAAIKGQPAKAGVYGVPPDDMIVQHKLATEAWAGMLPAKEVV